MADQLWAITDYQPPEVEMQAVLRVCQARMYLLYFVSSGQPMTSTQLDTLWTVIVGGYGTLEPEATILPLCASIEDVPGGGKNWTRCDEATNKYFPDSGSANALPSALWVLVAGADLPADFQGDPQGKKRYKHDAASGKIESTTDKNAISSFLPIFENSLYAQALALNLLYSSSETKPKVIEALVSVDSSRRGG